MRTLYRACAALILAWALPVAGAPKSLTLDDLFALSKLDKSAVSPDGEWIAATVLRPVGPNDVYGRTFYEMDVTRADVWLVSRRTGERRNLTQGATDASGYWCATWSPDGRRLAMMSTRPAAGEPRGGDNVRLYIWDKQTDALARRTSRGLMTQTMGGSAMYRVDLRGPQQRTGSTATCSESENAPFIWLDDSSLLAVVLPEGATSGIIDAYSRALKHAGSTLGALRDGQQPTSTVSESGAAAPTVGTASLQVIDATTGAARELATVPVHPFEGNLEISVAPNGRSLAVLASKNAIPHEDGKRFGYPFDIWGMDRRLGFVDFAPGSTMRWVEPTAGDARYPLDLQGWSKDGAALAVRARANPQTTALNLMRVAPRDLSVTELNAAGMSVAASPIMAGLDGQDTAIWLDSERLLARAVDSAEALSPYDWYAKSRRGESLPRADWWLLSSHAAPVNVTAAMKSVPATFFATNVAGQFVGVADEALWSLNVRTRKVTKLASGLPTGAEVLWPRARDAAYRATSELIVAGRDKDGAPPLVRVMLGEHGAATRVARASRSAAEVVPLTLPSAGARFDDYFPERSLMTLRDFAPTGTFLWGLDPSSGRSAKLLSLNEQLAGIALGAPTFIDYRGVDGQALKGAVFLPPDYQPGRKYPVLMWVYAGAMVRGPHDSSLSVYAPGQYNLRLYAARGYVVLMPSMPLKPDGGKNDDYLDLPKGALPALNRLIDMGIADPERLAVMGQSYGGFSVYSLVTYTNRFKAAIAMAGITDLVSLYGEFDRTARGYPGIEHQKSVNWGLAEQGQVSMGVPPWEDLWRYLRNSPINFVDRVQTPLLLIHGDQDVRGPITQAEEFFYALYRQGKRAKLLRYWGEDHGLRQSPANVREIVDEIFAWLQVNMPQAADATSAKEASSAATAHGASDALKSAEAPSSAKASRVLASAKAAEAR